MRDALRDVVTGRPSLIPFELTRIADTGTPARWLAISRAGSFDERIACAVITATARWRLTPRQHTVLELIVRGVANTTIAAHLGVSARAVELHVTALFDRVGVDSRAALVSAVLMH
ncbi:MAG: helix-turn-helix transcriptional regulator [Deltaproteobacteria bacterium]|nr:helix-turn-helix transcriptional regulator [Deltaproteobacteria bacterium]